MNANESALCVAVKAQLGRHPESLRDPLYVIDYEGRILFCNGAFAELLGERRERIAGRLSVLLYPPEAAPLLLMQRVESLLHRTASTTVRTRIQSRRGAIPVELTASTLKQGGKSVGWVIVVRRTKRASPSEQARSGVIGRNARRIRSFHLGASAPADAPRLEETSACEERAPPG